MQYKIKLEGSSDVLIESGVLLVERLKEELITRDQLEMAAHKQGFETLDEIVKAEIDPDGAITFIPRKPTPREEQYQELLSRIDNLRKEVISLKSQIEKSNGK